MLLCLLLLCFFASLLLRFYAPKTSCWRSEKRRALLSAVTLAKQHPQPTLSPTLLIANMVVFIRWLIQMPSSSRKWMCQTVPEFSPVVSRREHHMKQSSSARLSTPLIRENGQHRPATWDEALDLTVRSLQREIGQHGPRSFGMFSCSKTTNELNYIAQKFVRSVIGCNNIDSCNRT